MVKMGGGIGERHNLPPASWCLPPGSRAGLPRVAAAVELMWEARVLGDRYGGSSKKLLRHPADQLPDGAYNGRRAPGAALYWPGSD